MALVLLSGIVLIIVVAALSFGTASAVQVQERARRGAIAPIGNPIAGMLGSGSGSAAYIGESGDALAAAAGPPPLHRPTAPVTGMDVTLSPAQRGAEMAASVPRFPFRMMTNEVPIRHEVTAYVTGDDLFDVSFSLDDPTGEFAGEMGVSITGMLPTEGSKQVTALEVWLFDKNDFRSPTAVLMTPTTYADEEKRTAAEARGEAGVIEAGSMVGLVAESLQMQVIVVDVKYRADLPAETVIESAVLELAVWQYNGTPIEFEMPGEDDDPEEAEDEAPAEAVPLAERAAGPTPTEPDKKDETKALGPAATEEPVRTSYTIDYTRRVYVNQPFIIQVDIPGQHLSDEPVAPQPSIVGLPKRPGELAFLHRWYPAYQDKAKRYPGLKVMLKYREEEFQVPAPEQTALLKEGEPLSFEFLVKPLKADVLLISVEFYYMGAKWRPERDVEVLVTRDPAGKPKSITTRKHPGGLTGDVRLLQAETLKVDVQSFLTLNASEFNSASRVAGGLLTVAFIGWAIASGGVADVTSALIVAGSSIGSALSMVLAPWLVDAWTGRGG